MKDAFESSIDSIIQRQNIRQSDRESMYYICGWLLRVSLKAAKRRDKDFREQPHVLVGCSSFPRKEAVKDINLPIAKVDKVELSGGMNYANKDFYSFVLHLEFIFCYTLTPELLVMNGSYLIDMVYKVLNAEEMVVRMVSNFVKIALV